MKPIETIEKGNLKAEIFIDDMIDDPRKEGDHPSTMVCWHGRYNLGDKEVDYKPEDFFYQLVDTFYDSRKPRVFIPHPDDVPEPAYNRYKLKLREIAENKYVILPLFLYDHSGITISCGSENFRAVDSHGWDWGQVGWIYISLEKARKEWSDAKGESEADLRKRVVTYLQGEVEEYDQFLTGDVYRINVTKEDKCDHGTDHRENVDSCGGFYGIDYARQEAQSMLDAATKEAANG